MTDEEKKAISILKQRDRDFDELYCTFRQSFIKPYDKSIGIILELIEKQQKEIEELKKYKEGYKLLSYSLDNYTSNDKIKAKIEEVSNGTYDAKIVLQSLLEKK